MKKCLALASVVAALFAPLAASHAADLPDLLVSAASFNRSLRSLSATVRNDGPGALASSEKFVVTFTVFDTAGTRIGPSITQPLPSVYQGLASDRSMTLTSNATSQLTEEQATRVASITAKVRLLNNVAEVTENNNETTVPVAGARAAEDVDLPDLIVQSATLNRTTGVSQVYVLNQGRLDVRQRNSYSVSVEYLDDGGAVVTTRTDGGPGSYGLPKQHSEQLDDFLKLSPEEINQVARVRATVRMASGQTEVDTSNNTLEADVPGEHGLPDLIVTAASFTRSSRFTSVSVKNVGTITVPGNAGVTVRIEYLDDAGAIVMTAGGSYTSALTLNTNGYPIQRIIPQPSVEQAERITSVRATVDPSNRVEESNEDNNVYPAPIPVVVTPVEPAPTTTPDTTVTPDEPTGDLGILPTSRLYVFKRLGRTVRAALTFNKEKKVDLLRKYTNDTLLETRAIEKVASPEEMKKQLARYEAETKKLAEAAEALAAKDSERAQAKAKEMAEEAEKQRALLAAMEKRASEAVADRVKSALVASGELKKRVETPKETAPSESLPRAEEKKESERPLVKEEPKAEVKPVLSEQKPEEKRVEEKLREEVKAMSTVPTKTMPAPVEKTNSPATVQTVKAQLGGGIMRIESIDTSILKGRQVEFSVELERSDIAELQFDVVFDPAVLSLNSQSVAEHSQGAVLLPASLTSKATVSTKIGSGRATVRIASTNGALLNAGGPLAIANLRFTIVAVQNRMEVAVKNATAFDTKKQTVPVVFTNGGLVKVIAPEVKSCDKEIVAPVCGVDGKTYANACEARQAGVVVRIQEACKTESTQTFPSSIEMQITPTGFSPSVVDIAGGGTITFVNNDLVSHIVVRNKTVKTERIDPTEKTTMILPKNRAIYDFVSEQTPEFAATVVVH